MSGIHRIVVATDLSPASAQAIDHAATLADSFAASVDLVHVRTPYAWIAPRAGRTVITDEIDDALVAEAEPLLARGIPCVTTSLVGSPTRRLVTHARSTGADLIVVGSRRADGAARTFLGGLATRLLHRVRCPVLVVPG
jgi:nucleotide-binding universal stress UspA family protein